MYNEQIEELISAALADGVLTEKEKQILFKKAQAQGIDLDEFEIVLDARLAELQKAEKEKKEKSAPESSMYDDVRKCPRCGTLVPALASVCPECGCEFSGADADSSAKILAEKIEEINDIYNEKLLTQDDKFKSWDAQEQNEAIAQAIEQTPIPDTKADLFEFIASMKAGMLDKYTYRIIGKAYAKKYNESMLKVQNTFQNDKLFESLIAEHMNVNENYKKVRRSQKISPLVKKILTYIGSRLGIILGLILFWQLLKFLFRLFIG